MKNFLSLFVLISLSFCFGLFAQSSNALNNAVGVIKDRYAPDGRVALFDVSARLDSSVVILKGEVGQSEAKNALLEEVKKAGFTSIIDSVIILPTIALGEQVFGIVTVSVAHMRAKPSETAELVTQTLMGSLVKMLKKHGGWYYVQTAEENYLGWIDPDHLALISKQGVDDWMKTEKVIVTTFYSRLREEPKADALPICDVVMGDLLKVKSMKGNWVSLELPDRRKGYLTASETMNYHQWKKTLKPTPELILKTAKQFLGVPYLWGGTSSKGVDCSGFVKTVFRMNGIELTRDADQQGMQGDNVPIDENFQNIKPGDLLFFGARAINGKPERITHVAISLGGTEYIHSSGMVKYNSFDSKSPKFSESLKRKLVKVRRILGTSAAPGPAR